MSWKKVDIKDDDEMPKVSARLLSTTYRKKEYGAGRVDLIIFGAEVRAMAVQAGDEKLITAITKAEDWLVQRGLPPKKAAELLAEANKRGVIESDD